MRRGSPGEVFEGLWEADAPIMEPELVTGAARDLGRDISPQKSSSA